MSRLHALLLELDDLLVHRVVGSTRNTDLQLHCLKGLILLQLCRGFVELFHRLRFQVFDFLESNSGNQSISDGFIRCPNYLKMIPDLFQ